MKNKFIGMAFLFLLFSIISLFSIGCSSYSHIVGNWQDDTNKNAVEFTKDGDVVINSDGYLTSGKYKLIGNNVVNLNLEGLSGEMASAFGTSTWQYTISGDTMTVVSGGQSTIYHRVGSINLTTSTTISTTKSTTPVIIAVQPPTTSVYVNTVSAPYATTNSTTPTPETPIITDISKISATPTQTITVKGHGFGNLNPYNGNSKYIEISDVTQGWDAGHSASNGETANGVLLNITQWTDSQILISGFTGKYGNFSLHVGDNLLIKVWNAPSGLGPSSFSLVCGAATNSSTSAPVITSVSMPSTPAQTFTIKGQGFGNLDPYVGDSPFIEITNVTSGWNAGFSGSSGQTPNGLTLNISLWADNQIVISGFSGSFPVTFQSGDNLTFKIWNVPSGTGPASFSIVYLNN